LVGGGVVTPIACEPKHKRRLQRLTNIEHNSSVSFLVHHYEEDWSRLWWVRMDGNATLHTSGKLWNDAIGALVGKYPQYRDRPPEGEVIWIETGVTAAWASTG
jgi:PPOX class probable F420-dependent enzyme